MPRLGVQKSKSLGRPRQASHSNYFVKAYHSIIEDPHLTSSELKVYLTLGRYSGCPKICPSIATLVARSHLSERTVKRALRGLESLGYLQIERGSGRTNTSVYQLLMKGCLLCTPSNGLEAQKGDNTDTKRVPDRPPEVDNRIIKELDDHLGSSHAAIDKHEAKDTVSPNEKFVQEMATLYNCRPERVLWIIGRILLKAKQPIHSTEYYRKSFLTFATREQSELVQHLELHGSQIVRKEPAIARPDLEEDLKREAARIGFDDYRDAVSIVLRNLRRQGVFCSPQV
jgi:hypothetical protein